VAQSVKCPTLDLSSGLDLRVVSSNPMLGSMLGMEPTLKKKRLGFFVFNSKQKLVGWHLLFKDFRIDLKVYF